MVWKESLIELSGQPTMQEINLILKKRTLSRQWINFLWQVERKAYLYALLYITTMQDIGVLYIILVKMNVNPRIKIKKVRMILIYNINSLENE